MKINIIKNLVSKEMYLIDKLIKKKLQSPIELVLNISKYITQCKGKRIRPLILLLSAKSCGYNKYDHIQLGAIIEFIHTATLLHDDIIDYSKLRRGQKTVNNIWGNSATVLIGDFIYSKAFEMISNIDNQSVINILSKSSNIVAEGEIKQLANRKNIHITEKIYLDIIKMKTAQLISCSSEIGATISYTDKEIIRKYRNYGLHLGIAFQIIDDILDYCSDKHKLGKNIGDDIRSGLITLPIIHLLQYGSQKEKNIVKNMIFKKQTNFYENFLNLKKALYYNGSIRYSFHLAMLQVKKALYEISFLKENKYLLGLKKLAKILLERYY